MPNLQWSSVEEGLEALECNSNRVPIVTHGASHSNLVLKVGKGNRFQRLQVHVEHIQVDGRLTGSIT
jgi:hypothetical protein